MSQLKSVRLDTNVTPNQGATDSSSSIAPRRTAAARRGGRSAPGAAGARLDTARRAGRAALRSTKGVVIVDGDPTAIRHLRRAPRRQAIQGQVHRHGAAKADQPLQARRHARAARRYAGEGGRHIRPHAARAPAGHAAWPRRAAARPARLRRGRKAAEHRRRLDRGHSRRARRAQGRFRRRGRGAANGMRCKAARAAQGGMGRDADALPAIADLYDAHARRRRPPTRRARGLGDVDEGVRTGGARRDRATYRCPYQSHAPFAPNCALADVEAERGARDHVVDPGRLQRARDARARARHAGRARCGCSITRARALTVAAATTMRRKRRRSCHKRPASRCACSSCAGTSTAGTTTARRTSPRCAPASMPAASSSPTSITAGSTAGPSTRRRTTSGAADAGRGASDGPMSIPVNPHEHGRRCTPMPNRRVVSHAVPMAGLSQGGARCARRSISLLRSPPSRPSTSSPSRSKMDPLEFRRKNIGDERWLGVLNAAATARRLDAAGGRILALATATS